MKPIPGEQPSHVHALLSLTRQIFFFAQNKLTLLNQADFPVRGAYFKWLLRLGRRPV